MASQLDLDYNQFRSALDSVAGKGVNEWSSPNSGALKLELANGQTWTPSGAGSGIGYIPPKPAGMYTNASETYNEDGTKNIYTGLLPPGHYSEVDQSWHLDNPPPPQTYSFVSSGGFGDPDFALTDTSKIYLGREPDYRAAEPEKYLVSGDISTLIGQEGSNQHMNVEYVRQGDKLVPTSAPKMWQWQKSNELAQIVKFGLAILAPQFMGPLASALGVSNATAAAILNAGINVASGQNPLDAIKNAAISDVTSGISGTIAGQIASLGIEKALADAIGSTGGNVIGAIARGRDPLQALISGGVSAGVNELTSAIPGFSDLSENMQRGIRTTMGSVLQGKDPTQNLIQQALNTSLDFFNNQTQAAITSIETSLGGSLNQEQINTLLNAGDITLTAQQFADKAAADKLAVDTLAAADTTAGGVSADGTSNIVTSSDGSSSGTSNVDDLVKEINSSASTGATVTGGLSALSDASSDAPTAATSTASAGSGETAASDVVGGLTAAVDSGAGSSTVADNVVADNAGVASTEPAITGGLAAAIADVVNSDSGSTVASAEAPVTGGLAAAIADIVSGDSGATVASAEPAITGGLTQVQENLGTVAPAATNTAVVNNVSSNAEADTTVAPPVTTTPVTVATPVIAAVEEPSRVVGGLTQAQQDLINANTATANNTASSVTAATPVTSLNTVAEDNTVAKASPAAETSPISEVSPDAETNPVAGGLTQVQQDQADINENNVVAPVGGLNQVAGTTAALGSNGARVAGSNVLGNILKKAISNTASKAVKNTTQKVFKPKTKSTPLAAQKTIGSAFKPTIKSLPPAKLNTPKFMPVKKQTVPLKTNVKNLTPLAKISNLTSLIKSKG